MGYLDVSGKSAIGGADQTSVLLGNRGINFGTAGGDTISGSALSGGAGVDQTPSRATIGSTVDSQMIIHVGIGVLIATLFFLVKHKRK